MSHEISTLLSGFAGIAAGLLFVCLFFALRGHKKFFCWHLWEGGHGAMGDGYDCQKCELKTYLVLFLPIWRLLGRVTRD
jgi:hypothetical protein